MNSMISADHLCISEPVGSINYHHGSMISLMLLYIKALSAIPASSRQHYKSPWLPPSVLDKYAMSTFSTTSYYPFDSDALSVFSDTQTSNYLIGEWCKAIV